MLNPSFPAGVTAQKNSGPRSEDQQAAQVFKQADFPTWDHDDAMGESARTANLARRFGEFNCHISPMDGGQLLISSAVLGGLARAIPDVRVARILLRQWGGL